MRKITSPGLIVDPRSGDKHRAEDVIAELCAVLRNHGYGLIFNPTRGVLVLAKIEGVFANNARVIAEIERLLPEGAVWKEIDWTQKEPTQQ